MRRGYDRSWTVLLNAANQLETVEVPMPNAEGTRYRLRAWVGGNSVGVNVLIAAGDMTLGQEVGQIPANGGLVGVKMAVPRSGVGEVETDAITTLTVFSDTAPAGNTFVTVRLTEC